MVKPFSPFWKGDGHVTDDTLMTRVLVRAYAAKRDHLDAYDVERLLVPAIVDERDVDPRARPRGPAATTASSSPRSGSCSGCATGTSTRATPGVGNIVNCGAAMYIAPVGIANAGGPDGAYAEAIDLTGAHQSSYGREAAGVLAAAVAEALRPARPSTRSSPWRSASPRTATRAAIEAVVDGRAARRLARRRPRRAARGVRAVRLGRRALRPAGAERAHPEPAARDRGGADRARPAGRTGGDYAETVLGGVNYGRDSDSIASMGGALAGALGGAAAAATGSTRSTTASKLDIEEPARTMAAVALEIFARDEPRHESDGRGRVSALTDGRGSCLRVTWVEPEDLVGHELRQAREEGEGRGRDRGRARLGRAARRRPARRVSGRGLVRASRRSQASCSTSLPRYPRPLADRRAGRVRGDPGRGRPGLATRSG